MNLKWQPKSATARCASETQAFTFVEVLVSTALALFIFGALFYGISNGLSLLDMTRQNLRATQIIVSRMEGLRLCAWGNGTNQPSQIFNSNIMQTNFTDSFIPGGFGGGTNQGVIYYGVITVETNITLSPAATYATNMARVTITLNWTNAGYSSRVLPHTKSMSTYVARFGVQNYIYVR